MKVCLTLLVIFFSTISFGQNDKEGSEYFEKGLEFWHRGMPYSAIQIWTTIVENKIGISNEIYGSAFLNIGWAYWQLKNYEEAKKWYVKVIQSELQDSQETGSIMEPHANYKHKAAIALAKLYSSELDYSTALEWLHKADTVYKYWGFEGSSTNISSEQAFMLEGKASILQSLNKKKEAIRTIIIELICSGKSESFFKSSEDTLITLVDTPTFINEFDRALELIRIDQIDEHSWVAVFEFQGLRYQIPIKNIRPDEKLPHYWTIYFIGKGEMPEKQKLIQFIKERSFYQKLKH